MLQMLFRKVLELTKSRGNVGKVSGTKAMFSRLLQAAVYCLC